MINTLNPAEIETMARKARERGLMNAFLRDLNRVQVCEWEQLEWLDRAILARQQHRYEDAGRAVVECCIIGAIAEVERERLGEWK